MIAAVLVVVVLVAVQQAYEGCACIVRHAEMIDRDHPGLQSIRNRRRIARRRRERVGREAVGQTVRTLQNLVDRAKANHAGDRTERLFVHQPAVVGNIGDDRGREEISR